MVKAYRVPLTWETKPVTWYSDSLTKLDWSDAIKSGITLWRGIKLWRTSSVSWALINPDYMTDEINKSKLPFRSRMNWDCLHRGKILDMGPPHIGGESPPLFSLFVFPQWEKIIPRCWHTFMSLCECLEITAWRPAITLAITTLLQPRPPGHKKYFAIKWGCEGVKVWYCYTPFSSQPKSKLSLGWNASPAPLIYFYPEVSESLRHISIVVLVSAHQSFLTHNLAFIDGNRQLADRFIIYEDQARSS